MPTFFVNTDDARISNAFLATLGAAPGSTYLAQIKAFGLVNSVNAMIAATGKTTAADLATTITGNLGLTGAAATAGQAYLTSVTLAGASSTWAANLISTLDLFTTLQNDATYGTAASAYVARINSAVAYSAVAANNSTDLTTLAAAVGSAGSTGAGSTFTLTTGVDSRTASGFSGVIDFANGITAGALTTLNANDTLTGTSATNDSLSVTLLNASGAVGASTAAVAQVNTYSIPVPNAATSVVAVLNYGGVSTNVTSGTTSTTFGQAIAQAINQSAGRTIAVFTAGADATANPGTLVVTAPVAGTPLPAITFSAALTANVPTVTFTTPNTSASGAALSLGTISSIEVLNVTNDSGQTATIDVNAAMSGVTQVNNVGSNNTTTFTNVPIGVATIGISSVTSDGADVNYTYRTGLTGTSDTLTINLSGVSSATIPAASANFPAVAIAGGAGSDGWDIVNITGSGSASRLESLTVRDGAAATTIREINISGSANVRVDNALAFFNSQGTVNASTNTGGVNLRFDTGNVTVTGGAGNDRFNFDGTTFNINDRVAGGGGTNTLALGNQGIATTDTDLIAAIAAATDIQNIEFTSNGNATYAANAVSQTNWSFTGAGGTLTVNSISGDNITIAAARGANAIDLNPAVGVTTLNLTLSNVNGNASGTTSTTDLAGFNTVNIVSNSATGVANAMSGNVTPNANASIVITGNAGLTLGTLQAAAVVDGSGAGGVLTLTGSTGNDSLTGGASADTLSGGAGIDVINGGGGGDAITGGTGADTINGGDGIDTYTVVADDAAGDSLLTGVTGALTAANLATFTRAWDVVTTSVGDVIFIDAGGFDLTGTVVNNGTTSVSMGGALANGNAVYWNDGTNTYLVINTSDAGANDIIEAADTLIILTGIRTISGAAAAGNDANYTILS